MMKIFLKFQALAVNFWLDNQLLFVHWLQDWGSWKKPGWRCCTVNPSLYYDGWCWLALLYEKDIFSTFIVFIRNKSQRQIW